MNIGRGRWEKRRWERNIWRNGKEDRSEENINKDIEVPTGIL